jgi:hypothetical protein
VEELHPTVTATNLLDLWRSKCPPGGVPHRAEFNVFTLRLWLGWLTVYEELDGGADFLNRVQFETRSTNLPRPPRGQRSELESTGFKLDAV